MLRNIAQALDVDCELAYMCRQVVRLVQKKAYREDDIRFSSLVKVVTAFGMSLKEFFSEGFE